MAKKAKTKQAKLPKKLLGVKIPKKTRRSVNALLKEIPGDISTPLLSAAVGAVLKGIVGRLEGVMGADRGKPERDWREAMVRGPGRPDVVRH